MDITQEEFNSRMTQHQQNLQQMFEESHQLENDIKPHKVSDTL